MLTSFIIPHKGREAMLVATLDSILRLDVGDHTIEILVITQNPSLALSGIEEDDRIRVFHRPDNHTISTLRNFGARQSRGEYLAFLDADIELAPDWLQVVYQELIASHKRVLVSVAQSCREDATQLEKLRTLLSNVSIDTTVDFLPGRNLFLRRATFDAAGGFPDHLATCEDYFFTDRVNQLGELYYSAKSHYRHLGEDQNYRDLFRKEIWRGQSNLQSLRGRRIPLRELPSFLVPVWLMLFTLLALSATIIGIWELALISLTLVVLPVLVYAFRLHRVARGRLGYLQSMRFYLVYFPARMLGTIGGGLASLRPRRDSA